MSDNPYQTPQVNIVAREAVGSEPKMDLVVSMLIQTKPWVRFISVMTFIASAMMVLGGLVIVAIGMTGRAAGLPAFLGFVYIVMALLYIVPAIFLWKYANGISVFVHQKTTSTLATALEAQKSFWKFVGIFMLVILSIYAVFFAIGIMAGLVGGS